MIGFDISELLLIWVVVIFAAVLRSFSGFGFALAAVPIFSLFLSPPESVVLSTTLILLISIASIKDYWGIVPLRPMLPIGMMMLIGTAIGTTVLALISKNQFQMGVGLFGYPSLYWADIF